VTQSVTQLRGDRVAVRLVVDHDPAEGLAGEWVEGREGSADRHSRFGDPE